MDHPVFGELCWDENQGGWHGRFRFLSLAGCYMRWQYGEEQSDQRDGLNKLGLLPLFIFGPHNGPQPPLLGPTGQPLHKISPGQPTAEQSDAFNYLVENEA